MASAFRHITPNEAQTPLGRRRRQRYTPLSSSHAYSRENTHARAEPQDGPSEAFAGASSSSPALPPPMRDRYIPVRGSMDIQVSAFEVEKAIYSGSQHEQEVNASPAKEEYKKCLASNLFGGEPANRVLSFASPRSPSSTAAAAAAAAASTADGCDDTLRMLYNANRHGSFTHREAWGGRHIPQSPERILDAPELLDDYYLNLLDWNADNILGAPSHTPAWARLPPPLPPDEHSASRGLTVLSIGSHAPSPGPFIFTRSPSALHDALHCPPRVVSPPPSLRPACGSRRAGRFGLLVERVHRRDYSADANRRLGQPRDRHCLGAARLAPDGHRHLR